jgi:hypothetical protein
VPSTRRINTPSPSRRRWASESGRERLEVSRERHQVSARGMTPPPPTRSQEAFQVLASRDQQPLDIDVLQPALPDAGQAGGVGQRLIEGVAEIPAGARWRLTVSRRSTGRGGGAWAGRALVSPESLSGKGTMADAMRVRPRVLPGSAGSHGSGSCDRPPVVGSRFGPTPGRR